MKALVTGGGGFIGRHVVEGLLARGADVRVLARGDYPALERDGVEVVRGDVRDPGSVARACRGCDAVFHTAARAGVWGRWEEFHGPNVTGTENVIAACREHAVPRLIHTSSPSVVFDGRAHRGADESLPYPDRYPSHYAHTKSLAEQAVLAANRPDLLTVALRPHLVYGPGDPHLLPRVVARARAGKLVRIGDGANVVDVTYVADVAAAHLDALDALQPGAPAAGRAYFITQGRPVRLWAFIDEVLAGVGAPPVRRQISLGAATAVATVLETVHRLARLPGEPRLTRFVAAELALDHSYDIRAAGRDLGYQPAHRHEDVLPATIEWLRTR